MKQLHNSTIKIDSHTRTLVRKILKENADQNLSFPQIMEKFYQQPSKLLPKILQSNLFNISPGTSSVYAFEEYLAILANDLSNHRYYREYSSSQGEYDVRNVIARYESIYFNRPDIFQPQDICITEGATGAISHIFEYFHHEYPLGEILIPVPSYYIFVFTAKYYGIPYKEILPLHKPNIGKPFFTGADILHNITEKTRMIILNHPHNPTGYIYSNKEIRSILIEAKKRNILILADELFFDLILEPNHSYKTVGQIAEEVGILSNLVVVKSYSKNRNLPGLRVGYLFSKNRKLIQYISLSLEQRVFFASGSNARSLIILDCTYMTMDYLRKNRPNVALDELAIETKNIYSCSEYISKLTIEAMIDGYKSFSDYLREIQKFYSDIYDVLPSYFKDDLEIILPKQSAFNTFVKLNHINNVNLFDFNLNLYLSTGVMADFGPCFGLSQREWETNPYLGTWLRITFSSPKDKIADAITRLCIFKREYLRAPEKFIHTNCQF